MLPRSILALVAPLTRGCCNHKHYPNLAHCPEALAVVACLPTVAVMMVVVAAAADAAAAAAAAGGTAE